MVYIQNPQKNKDPFTEKLRLHSEDQNLTCKNNWTKTLLLKKLKSNTKSELN